MRTKGTPGLLAAFLVILLWSITVFPANAAESGEKAGVKAPAAVMNAFHKAYPKATIRNISTEIEDSTTYFEIESTDRGQHRDLLYRADGTVFEIEEAMKAGDLPKPVTATITTKFPHGKLHKVERITRGDVTEYEVQLENGKQNYEVLLGANGAIKSRTAVKEEDEKAESGESDEAGED